MKIHAEVLDDKDEAGTIYNIPVSPNTLLTDLPGYIDNKLLNHTFTNNVVGTKKIVKVTAIRIEL